jgi:hypothetical protein
MSKVEARTPRSLAIALAAALAAVSAFAAHLASDNARLKRELEAHTAKEPPPAARRLSDEQRAAMRDRLAGETAPERAVWFATASGNSDASAFQVELESVFKEAGWRSAGNIQVRFPIKPGIYFFIADESPPAYVETSLAAFASAGVAVTEGRGYRAYYEEKKRESSTWNGFELKPDQTYVVVIGSSS